LYCALAAAAGGCGGLDSSEPADDRVAVREVIEKTEDAIFGDDLHGHTATVTTTDAGWLISGEVKQSS
jgi:hypothetical protein